MKINMKAARYLFRGTLCRKEFLCTRTGRFRTPDYSPIDVHDRHTELRYLWSYSVSKTKSYTLFQKSKHQNIDQIFMSCRLVELCPSVKIFSRQSKCIFNRHRLSFNLKESLHWSKSIKMDIARQTVDEAIGRIKHEVELQREKSNTMCRLRTAYNW